MKQLLLISFSFFLFNIAQSQCDTDSLDIRLVRASDTDSNIPFEFERHRVYYNPTCPTENTLVINFVGTFGILSNFNTFPSLAANNGFHVVSIKYDNNSSEAIQCASSTDLECYLDYHLENLYGYDSLASISIDSDNSLLNRMEKLIIYLDANFPGENWGQFLSGGSLDWSKIIVAGHSQGGAHASFIAHEFSVKRALMFASPFEYYNSTFQSAPWLVTTSQTPDSRLYSFSNLYDEVSQFPKQYLAWNALGMNNSGDTLRIDGLSCPYDNRTMLYTADTSTIGTTPSAMHGSVYTDALTILDGFGNPVFEPVWKYMLGLCVPLSTTEEKEMFDVNVYPNPSNGNLTINSSLSMNSIIILNVLGERIQTYQFKDEKFTFNVANLTSGVYFIRIQGESTSSIEKVIVR